VGLITWEVPSHPVGPGPHPRQPPPYHTGRLGRRAGLGNPLRGDWCRLSPLLWSTLREGQLNGKARSGAGRTSRRRLKGLPGCQVSQAMASLAEGKRKITSGTYE
jgi:hypothetical protein